MKECVVQAWDIVIRILDVITWPLVVIVALVTFKNELAKLLNRIRSVKYKDFTTDFSDGAIDSSIGDDEPKSGENEENQQSASSNEVKDGQKQILDAITDNKVFGDSTTAKVLGTMLHYQNKHFGLESRKRWTFKLSSDDGDPIDFLRAIANLQSQGLVIEGSNGQWGLSDKGIIYVKENGYRLTNRFKFPDD